MDERNKDALTAGADGVIEGRNAVIEALRAGTAIDKVYLQKGDTDKTLGHIASKARAAGAVVVVVAISGVKLIVRTEQRMEAGAPVKEEAPQPMAASPGEEPEAPKEEPRIPGGEPQVPEAGPEEKEPEVAKTEE